MRAQASSKSSGSMTIAFGMVSIPVSIFTGIDADAGKITRNMRVNGTSNPVGYLTVDAKQTDTENGKVVKVARQDTHKVFTCTDGKEVPLSDEEIAAAVGKANGHCEIVCFLSPDEASKYVPEGGFHQLRPQTVKSGTKTSRPFDKAFMLLITGMKQTGTVALLSFVRSGSPKLGLLDAEGNLTTVHYENEVRATKELPEVELPSEELEFATELIGAFRVDEAPMMENEAIAAVKTFAETKAAGGPTKVHDGEGFVEKDNLVAQMKASIAKAKAAKKQPAKKSKKQAVKV